MPNYSISATQLTEGKNIFLRGKLGFARLTRLIEGAALQESDQRKVQNGMSPVGKPHTTATITHAEIVPVSGDPNQLTLEEQFVSERRYASKKNPDTGANFSIDSKGTTLPVIAIPSSKGDGTYDQDESGRELAQGVDVTLVLRVYKPRNFNNRGLALEQVIVHEEPRYYGTAGVDTDVLKAQGIVFNAPPRAVQASDASPVGDAPAVETAFEDGLAFPAPQPTAAPAAVAAPAPAQAQVAQAVATAPAQAPTAAPVAAPVAETLEQKLARLEAENASLKDAGSAVGAPTGPWNGGAAQQPGITYQG